MTQVTFYLLENTQQSAEQFACKLVEKAWRGGLPMHIHTEDEEHCATVDKLLWSWREDSFLPHEVISAKDTSLSEQDVASPITVGFAKPELKQTQLLINLAPEPLAFFSNFSRVCEIVVLSPEQRAHSRLKFRAYRQAGIAPEVHNLPM